MDGAEEARVEAIAVDDPILLKVWPNELYRVLIKFGKKLKLEIVFDGGNVYGI
jgi:hypothetical protein